MERSDKGGLARGEEEYVVDPEAEMAERVLRMFMRSTHINGAVFKPKLGQQANEFFKVVLPRLVRGGILEEVPYRGAGRGARYKLNVPMQRIAEVVPAIGLTLDQVIEKLRGQI